MISVIICGHFLASLQVHQPIVFPRSFCFSFPWLLACFSFAIPSFIIPFLLSSLSPMSAVKMDEEPSAFVTSSPCFPIKNNRRAFFLTVAGEIISSDPFSRSIFVASQSRWKKEQGECVFLYFFFSTVK